MPPIGETLREARMRQRLDIADVEERTKIRAKYLRALENEEWSLLPGPTFVKTFLRTYAEVVGVDPHLLVEEYRASHELEEDLEPPAPVGRTTPSRRESRRRPPPGPPSKGAMVGGLALALVAFLLILGLVSGGDEEPASQRAATDDTQTETQPRPKPRPRPKPAPPPRPRGVTVRVAPAAPTYACIDSGQGTDIVFEGTLEGPRTFKQPKRLRVNLGKRAVELRLNGKPVQIAPSPEPVGFDLTPKGATELVEGMRPCA
ncbi:MAG: helix-turn-helix domain-containing protein [Thermoleophilaceae bacterium]